MAKVTSVDEAIKRYGEIKDGKWADEGKWMIRVECPSWFAIQVTNSATGKDTDRIYMNRDMKEPFLNAIQNCVNEGVDAELKTFDGCWNIRSIRGGTGQSWHSWGLALDLNAAENPLGGPVKFSDKLIKCFTDAGFVAGAHFKRKDGMHFEYAG